MSKENWIGKQIGGRYRIDSLLGEGGMSAVYKAVDTRLDRTVAVKLIHPHLSDSEQFLKRFKREGTAIAKLRHRNIIGVLDFGQYDGNAFIILAYVDGGSVQEKLKQLKADDEQMDSVMAVTLAAEIGDALEYAHNRGLIHRDIKPANILLDKNGQAILTDFGLVKVAGGTRFTMTGAVMGTARYMSPEQIKSVTVDSRSDIYSLGVSLYEMVSGSPPYEGDTAVTTMMKHLSDPIPDLYATNPETPPQLARIINRAMAKEPADRYQTAGEMVAALRQVRAALIAGKTAVSPPLPHLKPAPRPIAETMIVPPAATIAQQPPIAPAAAQAQPSKKSGGKRWLWLLLLLFLLIGGGSAAAFFFLGDGDGGRETAALPTNTPIPATNTAVPIETATATSTAIPTATHTAEPTATATVTNTPTPSSTPTPRSSNQTGAAERGGGLPYDFEEFGIWTRGNQDNGSFRLAKNPPINPELYDEDEPFSAAELEYFFAGEENDFVVFSQNNRINGSPDGLRLWVYGDGSGHFLNAWILDAQGQTWQLPFGRVEHEGWLEMTAVIDTEQAWPFSHISGVDDGVVDYPISFRAFVFDDYEDSDSGEGTIYLDQLTAVDLSVPPTSTPAPQAIATSAPVATVAAITPTPDTGGLGRIVYVANSSLLTTDPTWSGGVELGSVASNSCSSPASTNTASYPLYFGPYCPIGGDNTRCASPNGAHDVIVNISGGEFSIGTSPTDNPEQFTFIFQGNVKQTAGIRWSPLSDVFLFIVGDTVYRGFPTGGYAEILPIAYQPYYSADGSMILYRKPVGPGVNDVFVANADGSNPRNVTNLVSVDKSCAAWVR